MADDQGFQDYSAALDRMRDAKGAGRDYDPNDINIVRQGSGTYFDRYQQNEAATQAPAGGASGSFPSPPSVGAPDPNSWNNIAKRAVINTAMALPDITIQGGNVLAHAMGDPSTVGMPSQWLREKLGVPEMGENATTAQRALEFGAPIVAGSLLPIGAAGYVAKAGSKLASMGTAAAANMIARPALAYGGSWAGGKLAGEPGAYIGGLLGGMSPELAHGVAGMASPVYKYLAAKGDQPSIPSAADVSAAADRLSTLGKQMASAIGPKGAEYAEDIPLSYGMLGNRAAKISEAEFAKAGATPAVRAQEAPADFMPRAAELAIMQRRELPPATPGNQEVINIAQQARANAIAKGVSPADVGDQSVLNAVQNWINSKMGNQHVDVTPTYNMMRGMTNVPGGADVTQLPDASTAAFEGGHNVRTAITGQADALKANAYNYNGRLMVPYQQLQDWKHNLGLRDALAAARPDSLQGLAGGAYDRVYGSIKNDIANSAPAGVSPEALNTAVDIEHRELAARDLPKILAQYGPQAGVKTRPGISTVMQGFKEGGAGLEQYLRATGGRFNPAGAPQPIPGSGDIRQTLADIATLHNATNLPGGEGAASSGFMQKAREVASTVVPGIGERTAGGVAGALISGMLGLPTAPFGGAALGFLGGPYGYNLARASLQQNPRGLAAMAGRPVPRIPSAPWWTAAPSVGTAVNAAVGPAQPHGEKWTPPPWTSAIPQRAPLFR